MPAGKKCILVVDRDPKTAAALSRALASAGLDPLVAEDRASSIDLFARSKPSAVLCNVDLGGEDGRMVCTAIRARPEGSIVPILFFGTGDARQSVRTPSEALAVGADYFFRLPIDFGYLASRVVAWTGTNEVNEDAPSSGIRVGGSSGVIGSGSLAAERTAILAQKIENDATIQPESGLSAEALGIEPNESVVTDMISPISPGARRVKPSLVPWGEPPAPIAGADATMPGWLAIHELRAADVEDARAHVRRGEALRAQGDMDGAIDAYQAAAALYERTNRGPAIALYKLILHLDPGRIDIAKRGAFAAVAEGRPSDAFEIYRRCAIQLEETGDLFDASELLRRMIELEPDEASARVKLGEIEQRLMMSSRVDIRPLPSSSGIYSPSPIAAATTAVQTPPEDHAEPGPGPIDVRDLVDSSDDSDQRTGSLSAVLREASEQDVSLNERSEQQTAQLVIVDDSELPEDEQDNVIDAESIDSGIWDTDDPLEEVEEDDTPSKDDEWAAALENAAQALSGGVGVAGMIGGSSDDLIASIGMYAPPVVSQEQIAEVASEMPVAPDSLELTPARGLQSEPDEDALDETPPPSSSSHRPHRARRPRPKRPGAPMKPSETNPDEAAETMTAWDASPPGDEDLTPTPTPLRPHPPRAATLVDRRAEADANARAKADSAGYVPSIDEADVLDHDSNSHALSAPIDAAGPRPRGETGKRLPLTLRMRRPPVKRDTEEAKSADMRVTIDEPIALDGALKSEDDERTRGEPDIIRHHDLADADNEPTPSHGLRPIPAREPDHDPLADDETPPRIPITAVLSPDLGDGDPFAHSGQKTPATGAEPAGVESSDPSNRDSLAVEDDSREVVPSGSGAVDAAPLDLSDSTDGGQGSAKQADAPIAFADGTAPNRSTSAPVEPAIAPALGGAPTPIDRSAAEPRTASASSLGATRTPRPISKPPSAPSVPASRTPLPSQSNDPRPRSVSTPPSAPSVPALRTPLPGQPNDPRPRSPSVSAQATLDEPLPRTLSASAAPAVDGGIAGDIARNQDLSVRVRAALDAVKSIDRRAGEIDDEPPVIPELAAGDDDDEPILDTSSADTVEAYFPPNLRAKLFGAPQAPVPTQERVPIAPSIISARTPERWPWPSDPFLAALPPQAMSSGPIPIAPMSTPSSPFSFGSAGIPDVLPAVPLFPDRGEVGHVLDSLLLLGQIRSQRSTGILRVEDGAQIVFADGQPCALRGQHSAIALADLLIASERIAVDTLRDLVRRTQPSSPRTLTRLLLERHLIHAAEAFVLLDRQLEDALATLLTTESRWVFDLTSSEPVLREELVPQTRDVRDRILDLIPRTLTFRECVDALGGTRAIIRVSGGYESIAHAADRRFLLLLDGRARLTEAIDLAAITPERGAALALAYVMFGLATAFPTRSREPAPRAPSRELKAPPPLVPPQAASTIPTMRPIPIQNATTEPTHRPELSHRASLESPTPRTPSGPHTPVPRASSAAPRRPTRAPIEAEAKLRAFAERMRTSDYFAILGVGDDADVEAIREAHRTLRFELRLEEMARSPDLVELVREVRRGLDEARDVLIAPELRARYQQHLKPRTP